MDKLLIVTSTFASRDDAQLVAETILNKRLAACAQISAEIESIYWWKDEIVKSGEFVLTLKTKEILYQQIEKLIKTIHPYDTPEIIGMYLPHVESEYRQWLCDEVC